MPPLLNLNWLARTPNFNPAADEEERRRRVRPLPSPRIVLPGGDIQPPLTGVEYAPQLPDAPVPRPMPLSTPAPPMDAPQLPSRLRDAASPISDYRGNVIGDMTDFQRDQYVRRGGTTDESGRFKVKRSLKDSLINAGLGFLQGAGTGGGLGAGLGGALAGGIGAAISPTRGRENVFNQTRAPMLAAQQQREQQRAQAERQARMDALKQADVEAGIGVKQSQADRNRRPPLARPERQPGPNWQRVVIDGQPRLVDVNAAENASRPFEPYIQPRPQAERRPSAAELTIDPESGLSVEEVAHASYEKRGGDQYVVSKLPADTRQILEKATVTKNGKERRATRSEIDSARRELDSAIKRQLDSDLRYTRGVIRGKALRGPAPLSRPSASKAAPKAAPKAAQKAQPTANLRDLEKLWR